MGKRKVTNAEEVEDADVTVINKETSAFVTCRKFEGLRGKQVKEFVENLGFTVKGIRKNLKNRYAMVDVGFTELLPSVIEKLCKNKYKNDAVVADYIKKVDDSKIDRKPVKANTETLSILNRLLCIRGISKFVSKRTVKDVFKNVESIIIPSQKGTDLRDVLLLFPKPCFVLKAINDFQGYELAGEKLVLELLVSVPGEVSAKDLIAATAEEQEYFKNEGEKQKQKKAEMKTSDKKKKVQKEEEEEDDDDEMEVEENDDDDDEDDDDVDEEEEEELPQPPKKIQRKK